MEILERITEIRKAKKISVYKLADKCGISRNAIYNWYSKNYCPSLETLKLICEKGFEMSLSEFFSFGAKTTTLSPEIEKLISNYQLLSCKERQAINFIMDEILEVRNQKY